MFGGMFGKKRTTKGDVILALAGALVGAWKAFDTVKQFKADELAQKEKDHV